MNQDENELTRQRREKLEALRRAGVDPFGGRYPVTHWARDLAERLGSAGESELKGFGPVSLAGSTRAPTGSATSTRASSSSTPAISSASPARCSGRGRASSRSR